jgi:hypothetical protein
LTTIPELSAATTRNSGAQTRIEQGALTVKVEIMNYYLSVYYVYKFIFLLNSVAPVPARKIIFEVKIVKAAVIPLLDVLQMIISLPDQLEEVTDKASMGLRLGK